MQPTPTTRNAIGIAIALMLIGAVAHSSKAIFIKLAYRYDVDSVSLVALRMAFALPFYLAAGWYNHRQNSTTDAALLPRQWAHIVVLGLLGYYAASLLDFWSLHYLTASLGRLILFTYPTMVLALSAIFLRRRVQWGEAGAVLLSYLGLALAFSQSVELAAGPSFWWGVLLSLGSALTYAIYLIGSGEYLPRLGILRYTSLTMGIACGAILIHHGIQHQWALFHFARPVYGYALGMALIATVLPSFLVAEGIRRLGAGPASIISSIAPISTIVMASFFLGEAFGPWQWVGAVLVMAGVALLSWWKRRGR